MSDIPNANATCSRDTRAFFLQKLTEPEERARGNTNNHIHHREILGGVAQFSHRLAPSRWGRPAIRRDFDSDYVTAFVFARMSSLGHLSS